MPELLAVIMSFINLLGMHNQVSHSEIQHDDEKTKEEGGAGRP